MNLPELPSTPAAPDPSHAPHAPLRILMYAAFFAPEYSGAAIQALTLAGELRRRGHHVEFVTNRWPGLADSAVVDGFAVRRLEPGRLRKHREFRLWLNLARYAWTRRKDFDILHSHGAYYTHSFIGPLARALGLGSLVKASLADDDLHGLAQPLVGRIHRAMLRRIGACVGISRDLVEEFRRGGMRPERIHYLPNGVDTARFARVPDAAKTALRAQLGLPPAQPLALYVGVLDKRKNICWLAEQWVAHDAFGTGAMLVAVGPQSRDDPDGALRNRLAALARAHPARFVLHDFHDDLRPYYRCADLLVLPSVNEGLPNVMLEAMACSLPCVAARASGSRELVMEGVNGYIYTPDDADALALAVQRCLSPAGAGMGERAREMVERQYSILRVADRYETIYARLLAQRRGAAAAAAPRPIVYVENGIGYGGAVTCLLHLVRAIDRRKYEPIVVTGQAGGPYKRIADDACWLAIPDRRVDVTGLRRRVELARWASDIPALRWLLLQSIARLDDAVNFLPQLAQLTWRLWRLRPAVVHANNEPLCNRAAVVAAWLLKIPLVSHVRGDQFGSRSMKLLFRLPDRFIPVSRWIAGSIAQLGVPSERSTLIYDGIDFSQLDPRTDGSAFRERFGVPRAAFAVGLPGVLIAWKGQALFLEAVRLLEHEFPDLRFLVIGGTPDECRPYEAELREFVARHALQGRVTFTGHVSDMTGAYAGLDLVVSASTSPEPLGMVVVEAMAMQRPVVAPAHGGALEVVEHEKTGLLFSPNDAPALAAAIRRCRVDAALRQRLASSGRRQVIDIFSIERRARDVEALYDGLLESQN
ncbi:MAG: glycosyltransferase family 4 protein [Rubrivivax sp.]